MTMSDNVLRSNHVLLNLSCQNKELALLQPGLSKITITSTFKVDVIVSLGVNITIKGTLLYQARSLLTHVDDQTLLQVDRIGGLHLGNTL